MPNNSSLSAPVCTNLCWLIKDLIAYILMWENQSLPIDQRLDNVHFDVRKNVVYYVMHIAHFDAKKVSVAMTTAW